MFRRGKTPMNQPRKTAAVIALAILLGPTAGSAAPIDPNTTDARAILTAVKNAQASSRSSSRVRMSIQDQSGKRERVFSTRTKRYDDAYKTLLLIDQPADLHDMGFLTIDYSARGRNDEQWIYLPKLHRVSRLADSGKSDSFVGSDFSISDMAIAGMDVNDYEARVVEQSVKVGDDDCWLIDTKPKNEAVQSQTGYSRSQLWISKSKLISLQFKGWLSDGKKTKYLKALDVRNAQGVWTPHKMQMRTLVGNDVVSETLLEVLNVDNNAKDVVDSDFTVQRLEQGA
jgi:hypothetical protein